MRRVVVRGSGLTIGDLIAVARHHATVEVSREAVVQERILRSRQVIQRAIADGCAIYGVTTGFGGMSHVAISPDQAAALQANLLCFLKTGCGERLPEHDVRSGMLLRANSLARGVSGVRPELIERLARFLNERVTPHVMSLGSIGASGDLVPLSYVAGALIGSDNGYLVDMPGETVTAVTALKRLGLEPITLEPKEGLALVNGTSMLTGIAAGCSHDAWQLAAMSLAAHAVMLQALMASGQPFAPFIHDHKPHPGQRFAAARMVELLAGSKFIRTLKAERECQEGAVPIQDRYSVRCLPQYFGPILDGLATIRKQIEVEMNSATDNPLLDPASDTSYHGGNFLGQYIAVGMDQCRYYLGLVAKHLDVQISVLMEPAFSGGLSASLVGNPQRSVNMGLKGLQLVGNSIMPLIGFYGNSLADRFPTHAEQFNQNINSQGFGSAHLARQSVALSRQHVAIALIVGIQAVELRTRMLTNHCDARRMLSAATIPLYETLYALFGKSPDPSRPLVFNDNEQSLDHFLNAITADMAGSGRLWQAIEPLMDRFDSCSTECGS